MINAIPGNDFDLSTIRKLLIIRAVEQLMDEVSFDDLTVKMICEKVEISRQTFYRHFQDKYDMAPWYWNLIANEYLAKTGCGLSWYEGNYYMLCTFKEHQNFFTYFYRTDSHEYGIFRKHSFRQRSSFLKETIVGVLGKDALTPDLEFQIEFFADAESREVERWTMRGMDTPPERMAELFEKCVPPELHEAIERAEKIVIAQNH
ncbi:probable dihydroxyacetone kinase regulator [Slackia heliotrinireducens]|uniref:Transcriptional regulator, tetR family n=1 Tax=Slackia heliotrinireducens (strain ATCC 29202 / DSM 20476 / NCTC 11029 / RHS 1) TaxID=471855 RepID=C7N5H1_SLAHD|nr:TetR/AcrR family transcriptional regulator C-terminal domain-containing protein [Slackia heliotrinireducens]ACV22156.1 transcriptional regulator, tetR family [Slackia heliotrinireducens DSM 20476]VEH00214.1 probable dihydroxyacetone kinase regulator [Slackia heliotrinireducens]